MAVLYLVLGVGFFGLTVWLAGALGFLRDENGGSI